jgi:PKD repeat protein
MNHHPIGVAGLKRRPVGLVESPDNCPKIKNMKTYNQRPMRHALAVLTAGMVLGGMLVARADSMYLMQSNAPAGTLAPYSTGGGVTAQSLMAAPVVTSSNTTFSWYGMKGWSTVQASTNMGATWVDVTNVAATAHAWSTTVANDLGGSAVFRLSQTNVYVGQSACAGCHQDKYVGWTNTAHSSAINALLNPDGSLKPFRNPSCIVCHSVGMNQPGGYVFNTNVSPINYTSPMANVGCESCHGPSGGHKASDKNLIQPVVSIDPAICGSCHQDEHHPTFEEYEHSPHAEVNDDLKYGFANGVYYPDTIVMKGSAVVPFGTLGSSNVYGFYVTTNADSSLKTNATTGIIHSQYGNPSYVYDPGQDRAASCGVCHSAATRMAMLNDYEERLNGRTNALAMPARHDAAAWSAACATCHDPHSVNTFTNVFTWSTNNWVSTLSITNVAQAQMRNPLRSTHYYTMPTTTDKRTIITTNGDGSKTTNVVFMGTTFASMYDPTVQVCAQCHNSRGARWDGRSYGLITSTVYSTNTTEAGFVPVITYITNVQVFTNITYSYVYTNGTSVPVTNTSLITNSYAIPYVTNQVWSNAVTTIVTNNSVTVGLTTNITGLSRPPHHSPQYNMLIGILQDDYFNTNSSGVATNWLQRHGTSVSSSSGAYNTNQCATCHVPRYTDVAGTHTGHTFEVDTKGCTISGCHSSVPLYEEVMLSTTNSITRIVSLLNQWAVSKGPGLGLTKGANNWDYTTTGALAPTPNTSNAGPASGDQATKIPDAIKQARFNIYMLLHDGSLGVHNPRYAAALTADAENKVLTQFPMANFKALTNAGYVPFTVMFTNTGVGATGWSWNFGDGVGTDTVQNPTYVYNTAGTYAVTLTATDGATSETVTRTNYITVSDRPVVTFTADQRTNSSPMTVNFTNTSSNTNSVTLWRWTIDGQSIYSQDATYTFTNNYSTNRSFNIALRAYTPSGTLTSTSNSFIVVTPPAP